MSDEKVYCNNCKFIVRSLFNDVTCGKTLRYKSSFYKENDIKIYTYCAGENEHNNCSKFSKANLWDKIKSWLR